MFKKVYQKLCDIHDVLCAMKSIKDSQLSAIYHRFLFFENTFDSYSRKMDDISRGIECRLSNIMNDVHDIKGSKICQ